MINKLKKGIVKLHALILASRAKDAPEMLDSLKEINSVIPEDEFAIFADQCGNRTRPGFCKREEPPLPECNKNNCRHLSWLKIKEKEK
ncbi:MAG: hypothetical protein KAR42_14855 [candidate division Zixibacteria bacterium]|nr:hypothetical protein [candidate division Zixibacteria bacterium]